MWRMENNADPVNTKKNSQIACQINITNTYIVQESPGAWRVELDVTCPTIHHHALSTRIHTNTRRKHRYALLGFHLPGEMLDHSDQFQLGINNLNTYEENASSWLHHEVVREVGTNNAG